LASPNARPTLLDRFERLVDLVLEFGRIGVVVA